MSFGVTDDGFKVKRLEDVQSETTTAWQDSFGQSFDLDFRRPAGQIKEILDERVALIWEAFELLFASQYPRKAFGTSLDDAVSLVGITRLAATPSRITSGIAFGTLNTVIPAGTLVSVNGNPANIFATDADSIIDIPAQNQIQGLTFSLTPVAGSFVLNFGGEATNPIAFDATLATIKGELEALTGIGLNNVSVTGAIDSATGLSVEFVNDLASQQNALLTVSDNTLVDGGPTAVVVAVAETQEGHENKSSSINMTATQTGPRTANAGSLTVIESVVTGLDSFTNLEDAELGTDVETDAELKARQVQQVQVAGSATPEAIKSDVEQVNEVTAAVVFQNKTDVTDLDGRPPHSVDIVVEGGDEDEIAQAIFLTVGAGINFFGAITKTVVDSQGFNQEVKFSRPTEVDIYLEVDLTIDPNVFNTVDDQGINDVVAAILAYGEGLEINDDVVVYGSAPSLSCSWQNVPGIRDFSIRVGRTAAPTTDDNIVISPREIAKFDSSRITVQVV